MTLPYPNDPASPSYPNPYFQDNAFVRGDQSRGNNQYIWANFDNLDSRITVIENAKTTGLIIGGLKFNSVSLPPIVSAGSYGVNGKIVYLSADIALALSDVVRVNPAVPGKSSNVLQKNCWYEVYIDSSGNLYYGIYGEESVNGGSVSSISGSGTSKTVTVSAAGSHTGKILIVTDSNGFLFAGKITGGNGTTTYTVDTLTGTITPSGSTTFQVMERISTLHITGVAHGITADDGSEIPSYTPSFGENSFPAGMGSFSEADNGFYNLQIGLTSLRAIGCFCVDNSSNVIASSIISYKSGRNKNDNSFRMRTEAGLASTATKVGYFTNYDLLRGCDYIILNDSTDGMSYTQQRIGFVSAHFTDNNKNCLLALNATDLTTTAATNPSDALDRFMAPNSGMSYSNKCDRVLYPGETIIEIGDGSAATRSGDVMFQGKLEIE